MDFEAFCSLGELHPECIHNYPDFPEHEEDAKKKTRFHDWLAHKCNNDRTRMLELRMEMTKKVYDWWLAHVHEYFMNRQSNAESEAIKEAHAQGVEFKKVIMTSLPVGRDHDDRPDQPFYQPRRSRATIEWKRGLGRLKQELAEEHGLTEFEGLIPQEEILPRVDWVVPDDLLANMLHTQVLDSVSFPSIVGHVQQTDSSPGAILWAFFAGVAAEQECRDSNLEVLPPDPGRGTISRVDVAREDSIRGLSPRV